MATHPVTARPYALVLLGSALVFGFVLDVLGVTPWLLAAAALLGSAAALATRVPGDLAFAGALALLLSGYVIGIQLTELLSIDLGWMSSLLLVGAGTAGVVALSRRRGRLPASLCALDRATAIALGSIVGLTAVLVILASSPVGDRLAWSMQNDAVWNMMSARFIGNEHGVSADHPNPSPLTAALIAAAFASGRAGLDPTQLLQHDVTRAAQLWLLLTGLSAVLAGLIAARALPSGRPILRAFLVFSVACIPLSWYVAGYAFQFGFSNATLTMVLLLCAWIAWMSGGRRPLASLLVLAAVALALLATWAPLVVVPAGLAAVVAGGAGRPWWRRLRGARLLLLISAAIVGVAYVGLVTVRDLLSQRGALSSDGAMFALTPQQVALIGAAVLIALVGAAILAGQTRAAVGAGVVLASSGLALAYLVSQRQGNAMWGYYPAKFAWLVTALLLVILAVSLAGWAFRVRRVSATVVVAVLAIAVPAALAANPRPTRESLTAMATIVAPGAFGAEPAAVPLLFELSDPREKRLVAGYFANAGYDRFINGWLLQQAATSSADPLRAPAYTLDGTNVTQLCDVIGIWGGGVIVTTRSADLADELQQTCPQSEVSIDLRN